MQALKDNIGLFADETMNKVNPEVLQNFAQRAYPSMVSFSREVGIPRTQVYRKVPIQVSEKLKAGLIDLVRVIGNAIDLLGSKEEALKWIFQPNPSFYNLSPFTMCIQNKGERVYNLQEELIKK